MHRNVELNFEKKKKENNKNNWVLHWNLKNKYITGNQLLGERENQTSNQSAYHKLCLVQLPTKIIIKTQINLKAENSSKERTLHEKRKTEQKQHQQNSHNNFHACSIFIVAIRHIYLRTQRTERWNTR